MLKIKKAYKEDFDKIYPLFEFFNNSNISKEQWASLFNPISTELNNKFFGFILIDEDKYIGFIGSILSIRNIGGRKIKFCNLSSWVIDPKYRKDTNSLLLLEAVLDMNDFHMINFTPMHELILYYTRFLGFKENITRYNIVIGFPTLKSIFKWHLPIINKPPIKKYLNEKDITIYEDHQLPNVFHVLHTYNSIKIYTIIKPTLYGSYVLHNSLIIKKFLNIWFKIFKKDYFSKKIYLGLVHYTNNPELFSKSIQNYAFYICKHLKVIGLSVNDKYKLKKSIFTFKNINEYHTVYRFEEGLNFNDIDTLYSEFMLLNLNQ